MEFNFSNGRVQPMRNPPLVGEAPAHLLWKTVGNVLKASNSFALAAVVKGLDMLRGYFSDIILHV